MLNGQKVSTTITSATCPPIAATSQVSLPRDARPRVQQRDLAFGARARTRRRRSARRADSSRTCRSSRRLVQNVPASTGSSGELRFPPSNARDRQRFIPYPSIELRGATTALSCRRSATTTRYNLRRTPGRRTRPRAPDREPDRGRTSTARPPGGRAFEQTLSRAFLPQRPLPRPAQPAQLHHRESDFTPDLRANRFVATTGGERTATVAHPRPQSTG